jgi:DNA-binding FadR family transcriptional regulator
MPEEDGKGAPELTGRPPRAGRSPELKPKKMSTLLAQRIAAEITDRDLPPGTVLPSERDMLLEHGVGRSSLREALRVLELQGVLAIKPGPGGGPMVVEPDYRHLAGALALLLQFARTPFRSIVEARQVLEPPLAALAAERIDAARLAELGEAHASMGARLGDLGHFLAENRRFHDLIAWASGNALFGYLVTSLHWITDGTVLGIEYTERDQRTVHRAHDRIYRAIRAGDAAAAQQAMAHHIADFAIFLEKLYPGVLDRRIRWEQITG